MAVEVQQRAEADGSFDLLVVADACVARLPLVKGLKVPVSTGSCVLGRMRASVGSWLLSVLLNWLV